MKTTRIVGSLLSLAVLLGCGSNPGPTAPPGPTNVPPGTNDSSIGVLLIGNSLTYFNDMPEMLQAMLNTVPNSDYRVQTVTIGGAGLQDHWAAGTAQNRIAQGGWDVVALQQGPSATEGRPSLLDYSQRYGELIRAVDAIPALYMVWPAVERLFDAQGVSDSYTAAARLVGGGLFPAGDAWRVARGKEPAIELYGGDGFHPSVEGSYLAALVMYVQLTGASAVGLPAAIRTSSGLKSVSARDAGILQQAADEASRDADVDCVLWTRSGCDAP